MQVKKMKEFDQRVKPLKEKNRKFLEKNVELTTMNRKLKDQIHSINDDNKTLVCTVNFLNIRTPHKNVVITLKFELCGSMIE